MSKADFLQRNGLSSAVVTCHSLADFVRIFFAIQEHLFLKRQNPEEKSAENLGKICRKICTLRTKILRKNLRAKICATNLRINQRTKISTTIVPRAGVKIPSLWKMKARKKKNLRQICAKPQ